MLKRSIVFSLIITAFALEICGQETHTPEKGSSERKAILDALRGPVERDLGQKIVFSVDHFSVSGNWAFISGVPQTPTGGRPNYTKTKYAGAVEAGAFDNNFFALIRKSGGKWRVTSYAIGCTDVCYADWWRRYKAPKAIFPYSE